LRRCHPASGTDVAGVLPGDTDPDDDTGAKYLPETDSQSLRTWRSGFPERHVRNNPVTVRKSGIYPKPPLRGALAPAHPEQARRHWLSMGRRHPTQRMGVE
jgi:hypothetical protein